MRRIFLSSRSQRVLLSSLLTLFMGACTHTSEVKTVAEAPLTPRRVFFGNPTRAMPQISPDGKQLAYLAPSEGVLNIWVAPVQDLAAAKVVTSDKSRGIRQYVWAEDSKTILYGQDEGGDENFHIFKVDLASLAVQDLTPFKNVAAGIDATSQDKPDEVLISMNDRDPRHHDLYRVQISSGKRTLLQKNTEGFAGFVTDKDFKVRMAMRPKSDGSMEVLVPDGKKWKALFAVPMEDALTTSPIGIDSTGKFAYAIDSRGRNTAALVTIDLKSGQSKVLAEHPKADASATLFHPTDRKVQAVGFEYERLEWTVIDPQVKDDFAALKATKEGEFRVVSRSRDDALWLVTYDQSNSPLYYYLYDRSQKKAQPLFSNRPELEAIKLAPMQPLVIKSRDGLELVSYLTLPVDAPSSDGVHPAKPLPMVLLVHGGPWARDDWGLDMEHQWLASRGYAVLSVNFRSSTGFGKSFVNAGNMEWSGKMHDDLLDAVNWAVQEKIADQSKVAIMGGSYGGYATLVGLTYTPTTFACGVDIVGPSNLETLLNSIPAYWAPMLEQLTKRVGDHRHEEGRKALKERSPLYKAAAIQRPLLIGQGANDPRVKQAEADQIVSAMREKKIPVTYVLYPDEGHGFARPANRISFNAVTESFLSQCLGGRYEPIQSSELVGSSMKIEEGLDHVPGIKEAMATPNNATEQSAQ